MKLKTEKIPKEILAKAKIVGNIFDNIKELKEVLTLIEKITSEDYYVPDEQKLTEIYKIAHAFSGHCKNPHNDWKEFAEELREKLKII